MFSLLSSLVGDFSEKKVITGSLVIGACLVFGGVVIKRLRRCNPSSWETLPDDIMGMIVPYLSVRDRIRLSIVCKPWSSVSTRPDIPSAPQLPWLLLPQSSPNHLSYFELSEGKIGRLELPEPVQGGWFQGSSKGWIIMVMEKDPDSTMFLVNPISGAQHQLPSLSTAPFFQKEVETARWKRYGASSFSFRLVLSTSDITSEQCIIAATFGVAETLCLCRPGDTSWIICEVLDDEECIMDLLFSAGKLYALVLSYDKDGLMSAPHTLSCGDQAVELKLVYDKVHIFVNDYEEYGDYAVQFKASMDQRLIESATNGEIYLIHQIQDRFMKRYDDEILVDGGGGGNDEEHHNFVNEEHHYLEGNEDGGVVARDRDYVATVDEEDRDHNIYLRTSDFYVYKLHPKTNKFVSTRCLEDQLLFLSGGGALSLPATEINELKGDSVYFATNNVSRLHSRTNVNRELGEFNFNDRRIKRSFPSVKVSVRSRLSWFTPNL